MDNNNQGSYNQQDNTQGSYQPQDYQPAYADYNAGTEGMPGPKKGYAITSLVLGIVSYFCCGFVSAVISLVFGILFLKDSREGDDGRGMAIAGIILSGVAILLCAVSLIMMCVAGISYADLTSALNNI